MLPSNPVPHQAGGVLLSVELVADELGVTPMAVCRLISFGLLKATRLPDTSVWKVLPTELQRYVAAGVPALKMPELQGTWFRDNPLSAAAGAFSSEVRNMLAKFQPAEAPDAAYKPGTLELSPKEALDALRKQAALPPIMSGVRLPNERSSFPTRGAEYLAFMLRGELYRLADPTINEQVRYGATRLGKLYDGPERFQALTKAAWDVVTARRFSVYKDYPARRQFENAPRVWVVAKLGDVFNTAKLKETVDAAL